MYKSIKSRLTAVGSVVALSIAFAAPAQAQNQAGDSLVNVQVADLTVLVPVSVAATLCDVNANILAAQAREGGAECTATSTSTASPAPSDGGGGNQAGSSLVNVQLDDTTVAIPVAVAADICDVNINALLAEQLRTGGATCEATANSQAS
jgi:hypothetical protein